jgi:hypothetical protein
MDDASPSDDDHTVEDRRGNGDGAPGDARVCAVATRPETFERCRSRRYYPCPRSYPRSRASFDYLACYRTAPVSAITHYARVAERFEDDGTWMGEADWAALIEPVSDESVATVFRLGDLVALDEAVANDRNGLRGAWYCTVDDLRAASTLSELSGLIDAPDRD